MKNVIQSIFEWLGLVLLNLIVKKRNLVEFFKVIKNYYSNPIFRAIDLTLLSKYIYKSPFAISKSFMQARGESDIYVYGETPLTTLERIAQECELSAKDTVFELGCGRGRGCFWLHAFLGCKVVGIEYIPEFMEKAKAVKEKYSLKSIEFREQDLFQTSFKGATVIYLYGTCFDKESIDKLILKILRLPSGTKIISVSYSLKEFTNKPVFENIKRFQGDFTWGKGDIYLQLIK